MPSDIRFENENIQVIFIPATVYYNRGPNAIKSEISIVFRNFSHGIGGVKDIVTITSAKATRPTKAVIEAAAELGNKIAETLTSAERFQMLAGVDVLLEKGERPEFHYHNGVPVLHISSNWNSAHLAGNHNLGYRTTSPEHEANKANQRATIEEQKKDQAAIRWLSDFEQMTPEQKLARVRSLIRA